MTTFVFRPNMLPTSRDMWRRYRVDTRDIGQRLLEILSDLEHGR